MLTKHEFEVLKNISCYGAGSLLEITIDPAGCTSCLKSLSGDELGQVYSNLQQRGYVDDFALTKLGEAEIDAYRVHNAVILAAGGLEMSPKLIYSLPRTPHFI